MLQYGWVTLGLEISGQFSLNEAIDLANVLNAGKLPASASLTRK